MTNLKEGNIEDDDTPFVNIMEGINKNKGIKESTQNAKTLINIASGNNHIVSPQKEKAKVMNQNDKMERNTKRRLKKRKLIVTSDSKTDAQANVQDVMTSAKKKARGKKISANVVVAPLDNVSFHSESSVGRWNYIVQRRINCERELG